MIITGYDEAESNALAGRVMEDWESATNEGLPYMMFLPQGTKISKNPGPVPKGAWVIDMKTVIVKTFEPEILQVPRLLVMHGIKADMLQPMADALSTAWEQAVQRVEPMELDIPFGVTVGNFPGHIISCSVITPKDGPPEIHIEMNEGQARGGRCAL